MRETLLYKMYLNISVLQVHHKLTEQITMQHHIQHQNEVTISTLGHSTISPTGTVRINEQRLDPPPSHWEPHQGHLDPTDQVHRETPTTTHLRKPKPPPQLSHINPSVDIYQWKNLRRTPILVVQAGLVRITAAVPTNHYTCTWIRGLREEMRTHRHPCRTRPHITARSN